MKSRITVRNAQRGVRVDVAALQSSATKALRLCVEVPSKQRTVLQELGEVHVVLVSDRRMALLHRQFLNQTGPTDVITFAHGEIFISTDTALQQAKQFGNSFLRELQLYLVHGLLHLHGFDDRDERDKRRMNAAQKKVLNQL